MLQRIQTVFLSLAGLSAAALLFTAGDAVLFGSQYMVMAIGSFSLILAIISIFSYKQRQRQLMLNTFNLFINVLLIGVLMHWLLNLSGGISFPEKGIEPVFPVIAIFCLFMANIYIRRDERLVKSVDRLR